MHAPFLPRSARLVGVVLAWALGALLVAAVIAVAWIGVRGANAYSHLQQARTEVAQAAAVISDPAAAEQSIARARAHADTATGLMSDPVWKAAEGLPWIGPQLSAVSTLSAVASDVATSSLAPLSQVASSWSIDSFRVTGGALDVAAISALAEPASQVADGLNAASAQLAAIDPAPLLEPVRAGLSEVEEQLTVAADTASALQGATALLPPMLGANGGRTWLVLFQNPAELRSLGGMPGATAVITANGGQLKLVGQGDAGIPRFDEPVLPLDPELQALYQRRPGVWFSGTTLVPDFTVAAPLAREMWAREHGVTADGVMSVDPIAMSYVLQATGPVTLANGFALTADNAVQYLLNQVYLDYPNSTEQNAVFADAAARVFGALTAGKTDPASLISALTRATDERRLMVWSADAAEQERLAQTTLAGGLPRTDEEAARFGVYLNDGTGSKLGYYLNVEPTIELTGCGAGVPGTATLTVNLRNVAPGDAATSLPGAIAGGNYGVPAGVLRVVGYVYLPQGSTLTDAEITHAPGFGGGMHQGYRVLSFATDLAPGDTSTSTITVDLGGPAPESVVAQLTPAFGSTSVATECAAG